jgi:hypothetical protein
MIKLEISSFIQDEYPSCNVPKHIVNKVEMGWLLGVGHLDYPLFHLQLKRSHCIEQNIALHSHTPSFDKLILRRVPRWEGFELLKMLIQWSKRNKGSNNGCTAYGLFLLHPFTQVVYTGEMSTCFCIFPGVPLSSSNLSKWSFFSKHSLALSCKHCQCLDLVSSICKPNALSL